MAASGLFLLIVLPILGLGVCLVLYAIIRAAWQRSTRDHRERVPDVDPDEPVPEPRASKRA